ncbi:YtxH domain-containing protein [Priestia megaterium]|uniref:YtxH domain-containing protein n=1 Tax=Priestia megaterium TaxID=1404 RepID=UPI0036DDA7E0
MSRMKKLAAGAAIGSTVAAITTLLVTPYSGRELKQRVSSRKDRVNASQQELSTKIKAVSQQVQMTAREGNTIVKNIASDLSTTLGQFKEEIVPHKESLQHHLKEIQNSLSNLEEQVQTTKNPNEKIDKKEG